MKKVLRVTVAAGLAFLLLSCGGGGEDSGSLNSKPFGPPSFTGATTPIVGLIGLVVDANTGAPLPNVTVTAGTLVTTTDAQGNFAMPTIATGTNVVSFTLAAYAPESRTIQISSSINASVVVQMMPNATTTPSSFDPTAGATASAGTAQVVISGGSLRDAAGNPPTGTVNVALTPLTPSLDAFLLPGDYVVTLAGGGTSSFEAFGAVDVSVTDSSGTAFSGALAAAASIQIPVDTRSSTLPASVSLMRFDPTTGLWIEDGTATLQGTAPNQFYGGSISRPATWAAGQAYTASNITACVTDTGGRPIAGARVVSDGIDYTGGGTGWTNTSGVAVVPMKRGGQAVIGANSPRSSNSASISAAQSAADFTLTPCLIMPLSGMTIRLTWGQNPLDLDSHLLEPNGVHIAYFSRGSLTSAPFAALDVDDVTSFGPEVITITRLTQGVNEYFVHNFNGTFGPGITASPTRVEVRVGSQIAIYRPGTGEGTNVYWRVFQFTVGTDCSVTLTPLVNSWAAAEPPNPAGTAAGTLCN